MEMKYLSHGNHILNNDKDGYTYCFSTSEGYTFGSHLHSCYEFIHILRGQLIYTVEGSEYLLSDGDIIMTNPSELHSFSFPKEHDYQREFLHIYPGFVENFPELTKALDLRRSGYFNRIPAEIVRKYRLDKIFRDIEECCAAPEEETDSLVLSYTLALLAKTNQILRKETAENQEIAVSSKTNSIREYIDSHCLENVTAESIASAMFISPSYLSRLFRKETGMTIKSYLNLRRITIAKNLILDGKKMIKNIYLDCGYNDYSTFYRAFVKYAGMSPDEFKKNAR